jgi:periplasmic divalent cation tolerance protein
VSRLVADRLAACGQVDGPVRSTYRWNGVVESAEEWRCTLKTTPALVEPCVQAVVAAHPYDTPEVLVARVHATKRYAAWVRASVGEG